MRGYEESGRRETRRIIQGSVLVLMALVVTASRQQAGADGDTQANQQRIARTIKYRDTVIEQWQLPEKPEITVIVQYKKDATKPMPVMLGWFGRRDRKIVDRTQAPSRATGHDHHREVAAHAGSHGETGRSWLRSGLVPQLQTGTSTLAQGKGQVGLADA